MQILVVCKALLVICITIWTINASIETNPDISQIERFRERTMVGI